jgi:hypothetical protein
MPDENSVYMALEQLLLMNLTHNYLITNGRIEIR